MSIIDKPSDYFNTVLYTGNGSTQSITGVGFQPDWVWIKRRNAVNEHRLTDAVRGATKELYSDSTTAETTNLNGLTSFDSNGFSLGSSSGYNSGVGTTYPPTSYTYIVNTTISEPKLWGIEACDSDGDCGFSTENRTVFVDTVAPSITLSHPATTESIG